MNIIEKISLRIQRIVSFIFFLFVYYGIAFCLVVRRYKIKDRANIRRQFQQLLKKNEGPFLICANHLTFADTFVILWGLNSGWNFWVRFYSFPWNIPSAKLAHASFSARFMSYLAKTIPIHLDKKHANAKSVLKKLVYLLKRKNFVMLFPEGTRSTTGRLNMENYGYGAGQIF